MRGGVIRGPKILGADGARGGSENVDQFCKNDFFGKNSQKGATGSEICGKKFQNHPDPHIVYDRSLSFSFRVFNLLHTSKYVRKMLFWV